MRLLMIVVALAAVGCGSETPTSPTPVLPLCQTQNTAQLTLTNGSPNNLTFDVVVDNILRGTMAPGASVGPLTLTAGGMHTIESRVTNTSIVGCTSTTSFAACSSQALTCRY
jgi:hypothetical protein